MEIKKGELEMLLDRLDAIEKKVDKQTEKADACATEIASVHQTALGMKEKLWGANGFEGDVVEIKAGVNEGKEARKELHEALADCSKQIAVGMSKINGRLKVIEDWKTWVNRSIVAILGSGAVGGGIAGIIKGLF